MTTKNPQPAADNIVDLYVKDDHLFFQSTDGDESIVLVRYDAGDCNTFSWPLTKEIDQPFAEIEQDLRRAMFDERESGYVPCDTRAVRLPNGDIVEF